MVECEICHKVFRFISWSHLLKEHRMSFAEYRKLYHGSTCDEDIRLIHGNVKHWLGKKRDEATKAKIRKTVVEKGLVWSSEARLQARKVIGERYGGGPLKDPKVAAKVSKKLKERFKDKQNHPNFGRKMSAQTKELIRQRQLPHRNERRISLSIKRKDPLFNAKIVQACHKSPNKAEMEFQRINTELKLGFEFVGNGRFFVGTKNPDFVNKEKKQIIEVFGRVFHDPSCSFRKDIPYHQTEEGAIEYYRNRGYDCSVIWEDELQEPTVSEKLRYLGYL